MKRASRLGLTLALWLGVTASAQAMGLFEVYEEALRNDPQFLGAIQERDAGLESRVIGRAPFWPTS